MSEPSHEGQPYQGPYDDLPDGVDPLGVPRRDTGRNAFIVTAAVLVATLALIFTLGWVVFHQLTADDEGGRGMSAADARPTH